jgi:hypothetical protein
MRGDALDESLLDPVAQELGRHRECHDRQRVIGEFQTLEPAGVDILAELRPQTPLNTIPRHLDRTGLGCGIGIRRHIEHGLRCVGFVRLEHRIVRYSRLVIMTWQKTMPTGTIRAVHITLPMKSKNSSERPKLSTEPTSAKTPAAPPSTERRSLRLNVLVNHIAPLLCDLFDRLLNCPPQRCVKEVLTR